MTRLRAAFGRRAWPWYLVWAGVLLLAWIVLRQVPFTAVLPILTSLRAGQILILVGLNVLIFLGLSSRWWLLLRAQGYRVSAASLVRYRLAAFGLSYFSPGPQFGGEPLQVYLVSNRHSVPGPAAIASVSLDKLLDLLGNFTFLAVGMMFVLQSGLFQHMAPSAWLGVTMLLFALPLLYLLALWLGKAPLSGLLGKAAAVRPLSQRVRRVSTGLAAAEQQVSRLCRAKPLAVVTAMALSGGVWALMLGEYWLALYFLGQPLTLMQVMAAITAARIAFLLPSPGGLGTLEASQALVMQALGINPALGLSAALLIRARDILFGALGLWWGATLTRKTIEIRRKTEANRRAVLE